MPNSSSEYSENPKFKTQILHLHGNEIIWSILTAWMLLDFIEHIFRNKLKAAFRIDKWTMQKGFFYIYILAYCYALIPINFFVHYSTVKNIAFHDSDQYT